ncbi:MAG: signal peptidase I [Candidatus Thermoplasmatota archaeon]|nr:signal peptidase I [Candidatus Thermoplasmatota archaeon]
MHLDLKKVIGNIIFAAVLLLIIGRFLTIVAGTSFPMSVVSSHSMRPALFEGDMLPWIPCSIKDVREGDVIIYESANSWGRELLIAHRVLEVATSNGKITLITKGDANNYTDQAGPHVPEPPVNDKMLKGKAILLGRQPIKIPFAGYPWLWIQHAFKELSKPMAWGKPQADVHYAVFVPTAVSVSLLVAGVIIWAPENGKSLKDKLKDHIFGPERLSSKRVFVYSLFFYLIFLMIATSFSYDKLSSSLGVDKTPPKSSVFFGSLSEEQESFPQSISVVNPSLFSVKGFIFSSGNISGFLDYSGNKIFTLKRGGRFSGNITAYIPRGTELGTYTGNVYIYSSPYWKLIPSSFIRSLHNWNPRGTIIALSVISALVMSIITSLLLMATSIAVGKYAVMRCYLSWTLLPAHVGMHSVYKSFHSFSFSAGRIKKKCMNALKWMDGELHWIEFGIKKPFIASIGGFVMALPLLYCFENFVYLLFLSSFFGGIIAYAIGCRWRAEIMLSALLVNTWFSSLFAVKSFLYIFRTNHSLLVPFSSIITIAGIILFLFAIMAIPACLLSWLPGYAIHSLRERLDYGVMLKGCDI